MKDVARLWRELGHTPKSVAQYQIAVIEILKRGRGFDYLEITADCVDSWAQQYAEEHGLDPAAVMRRWLPAFRAFAWGLKQIGKATGSVVRSKAQVAVDPTVEAFIEYGRSLGWKGEDFFSSSICDLCVNCSITLRAIAVSGLEPGLKDVDDFLRGSQPSAMEAHNSCRCRGYISRAWLRFLFCDWSQ